MIELLKDYLMYRLYNLNFPNLIYLIMVVLVYLLPSIIALCRRKENWFAILILNFFLGWTLIGWVGALVWAVMKDK